MVERHKTRFKIFSKAESFRNLPETMDHFLGNSSGLGKAKKAFCIFLSLQFPRFCIIVKGKIQPSRGEAHD